MHLYQVILEFDGYEVIKSFKAHNDEELLDIIFGGNQYETCIGFYFKKIKP